MLSLKDQTFWTDSIRPFLEIDVKGGERDHIKAYLRGERDHIKALKGGEKVSRIPDVPNNVLRGRKRSLGGETILKDPRCLMFKRRDVTSLFRGKAMFICFFQL